MAPENEDVWRRGQTYTIKWNNRHLSTVIISLKSLVPIYTDCGPSINTPGNENKPIPKQPIGEKCVHYNAVALFIDTSADGVENWEISYSITPGNYSISVYNYENQATKDMDGSFQII